eukprot:CAMPEP_0173426996 /NCGR_PEP_ID=MMETSP1357-20121228/6303_1 /TAXON_ID=77926 /ORGANISM="Hemiselmis rufescens, Strain PCC563" /LENGTH=37 /DNA_ID= /DNA_START= /DNA_END= /DNA_ORIENTATION=
MQQCGPCEGWAAGAVKGGAYKEEVEDVCEVFGVTRQG